MDTAARSAVEPVRFAREAIGDVIEEIKPLLEAHWHEIAQFPDIPLKPNYAAYEAGEKRGAVRIYTARAAGTLVGYAIYFVDYALHYSGSLQAKQDILYLAPRYRLGRTGLRLIEFGDSELAKEGVRVVYQHVKAAHDFGPLLERMGYTLSERTYSRRLA